MGIIEASSARRRPPVHQHARGVAVAYQAREQVEDLGMNDGWQDKVLARRRRPGQHENSRTDDGANAQRGQAPRAKRFLQAVPRVFRLGNQLVDGFLGQQLVAVPVQGGRLRSGCAAFSHGAPAETKNWGGPWPAPQFG
jgi:hypothetical protein